MSQARETLELLRAISVVMAKTVSVSNDGFSKLDGLRVLASSAGYIYEGLSGIAKIPSELMTLDENSVEQTIGEIINILRQSGKFTFRERDVAERILQLAWHNISEIVRIKNLPPTAELVEELAADKSMEMASTRYS